jgi:hypothetical protein
MMNIRLLLTLTSISFFTATSSFADETKKLDTDKQEAQTQALLGEIPTDGRAFVDVIDKYSKTKIIERLGEPAKADDVKLKDSGKVVASIWQYHNINTAEDGSFYQTTELDFIDDKVVMVVFMNHDGTEKPENDKTYELPEKKPNM